jgi:hypothetical protein
VTLFTAEEIAALTAEERRTLWQLQARRAREAARESLAAYMQYVFELEPAPHHRLLIEALEAVERGDVTRLLAIYPPGHAKSTIVSIIFPTWYIGRHPKHSLVSVTLTDRLAKLYGDAAANVLEYAGGFRSVFPTVLPEKSRGWSHDSGRFLRVPGEHREPGDKDPQLVNAGAGAGIVGRRAHGAIIDDVVDLGIARSDEVQLPQRVEWIQSSLLSRLQPGAWAVCIGTLWGEGDVVDVLRQSGEWSSIVAKAEHPSRQVWADVELSAGVEWRPSGFQEGAQAE